MPEINEMPDWIESYHDEYAILAYCSATRTAIEDVHQNEFEQALCGQFDSGAGLAEKTITECYDLSEIPEFLKYCIDWEMVWDSYLQYDYMEEDGYFFRCL